MDLIVRKSFFPDQTLIVVQDPVEEQDQAQPLVSFEESSHAYRKLEDDYEKFLSECGMSKWGYWRGGSPE